MQKSHNNYENLFDFFKHNPSRSLKFNASCEKTLQLKSPILNNFLEKVVSKSKKTDQQLKFNEKTKAFLLKPCENCTFCISLKFRTKAYLMISSALQIKHTPNLHYHVSKNINDLIQNRRTPKVILYKDLILYNEEVEYLKRFYTASEELSRLINLTEFYQYHAEIPKLHIYSIRRILKRFHTKKRKLEYIFVRKLLGFSINNDILESSYEQKDKDDDSYEKEKNKNKALVTNILKDISLSKEQSFKRLLEERKSSITFNEFSTLNAKYDKNFEIKDLVAVLQRLNDNSIEVFKPKLLNESLKSSTTTNFNFKKPIAINQHQRFSSNVVIGSIKFIEKMQGKKVEKTNERKIYKSNTDRNYDFKLKATKKTINLLTEPNNNTILSPKSPIPRINSDRNTRSQSKDLIKSSSISISKKKTAPFSTKNNGVSLHKKDIILHKKSNILNEKTYNTNSHLRFFSLNGHESSITNKLEGSTTRESLKNKEIQGLKKMKVNSANILINKKFVREHLEEFLLKGTPNTRSKSGKGTKNGNLQLIQGKNTQNLFKKIYQNDNKSPFKAKN